MSKYEGFTDSELVVIFHRFDLCTQQIANNIDSFLKFNPRFAPVGEEEKQADWFEKALALDEKEEYNIFEGVSEELRVRGIDPFFFKLK